MPFLFKAWMNPLKCPEIDLVPANSATPTAEQLLDYLFAPELDRSREAFVSRYREIANDDTMFIAPAEPNILQKLVWPLRHAKGSYALGNYLGCIALCGMVGEMVAILLWDISKVSLQQNGTPMDKAAQINVLGRTFENLGQERRTAVLRAMGKINEEANEAFDGLRNIRRRYLHLFSQPHGQVDSDARAAYKHASKVVEIVLGAKIEGGATVLREDLASYLTERNIMERVPEEPRTGENKS
jgi:hypothetical protein